MDRTPILTIGYGSRTFDEVSTLLSQQRVEYLIDVRSSPYSRFNLDFVRERLQTLLRDRGVRYVYMGDSLGGRPSDPECYRDGRVDYGVVARKSFYLDGIDRIKTAYERGFRVVLMCSEGKPHECHRAKLIGETLTDLGIEVTHIDENGRLKSQDHVITLAEPQRVMFDNGWSYTSRKQYSVPKPTPLPSKKKWPRVLTIGVYGFDEESFFATLLDSGVDVFCDVRMRRGVRGKQYAFVNSERLQERLAQFGIRYVHHKELAPDPAIRTRQKEADRDNRESKRSRVALSATFVEAYTVSNLANFDSEGFLTQVAEGAKAVVLFCVEREPEACHRSLIANRLIRDLGITVEHLTPCELSLYPRQ